MSQITTATSDSTILLLTPLTGRESGSERHHQGLLLRRLMPRKIATELVTIISAQQIVVKTS